MERERAMTDQPTCVLDAKALTGEGPLWVAEEQALYWTDIPGKTLNRFDPASGDNRVWPMEAKEKYGVNWDFIYVYGFPHWKGEGGVDRTRAPRSHRRAARAIRRPARRRLHLRRT